MLYEYEFEGEDSRCDEDNYQALPPSLLEHVRTVSIMHNHKGLNNRRKTDRIGPMFEKAGNRLLAALER